MNKTGLFLSCLMLIGVMLSCSTNLDEPQNMESEGFTLELSVTSGTSEVANETEIKERGINSIYVYAFDDMFPDMPDFMKDVRVKDGQSGIYHLKMQIRNKVKKRFYFFVNPPASVRRELVSSCSEERLKSLSIDLKAPMTDINSIPMSNYFEAYVDGYSTDHHSGDRSDEVFLYPDVPKQAEIDNKITEIPVFRSLGKITVQAYLKVDDVPAEKDGRIPTEPLKITELAIFNFNTDGNVLPIWKSNGNVPVFWVHSQQAVNSPFIWNKDLKLDLQKMSEKEIMVENRTFNIQIKRQDPIASYDKESPDYITHCYLCQNSFGEKISASEQEGVKDVDGNRTTNMIVTLSDGRVGEIPLPYLRRNDNLKVRIAVNKYKIDADFEIWKEATVTPDWNEEILNNR